jgi:GPH family glycoside/pentoside/hexuronide:cation symporter
LNASGFDVALGEAQPEQTMLLLRIFDIGVPLITSTLAILIMTSYKISEERAYDIRAELKRRREDVRFEAAPA